MELIDIEKCRELSEDELQLQVDARRKLQQEMLGWLYPSILQSEINVLCELKAAACRGRAED